MTRAWMGVAQVFVGLGVIIIGYIEPPIIRLNGRPYAYVAVMAVGAALTIVGALIWRDR